MTASSICSFANATESTSTASLEAQQLLPTVSGSLTTLSQPTSSSVPTPLPPISLCQPSDSESDLNIQHLELLHNFVTNTYASFTLVPAQQNVWCNVAVRHALAFPFLMYQILAVSALHLAHLKPAQSEHYLSSATKLQNHAMNGFNLLPKPIDESSCAAVLIFSSLLALHVLADPTRTKDADFGGYIDHFTSCIRLMRSVRGLVISDFWHYLKSQSEFEPLLKTENPSEPFDTPVGLKALHQIAQNEDLSDRARAAYESAIDRLEWLYAVSGVPHHIYSTVRWILSWPVQLTDEYLELLNERRPEALIILSYYGVILTFYRNSWVVGDKGIQLVKAINSHLGGYWDQWMQWAMEVIDNAEKGLTPVLSKE